MSCDRVSSTNYLCPYKVASSVDRKVKDSVKFNVQLWLGLAACLIWIIAVKLIRVLGRRKNREVDEFLNSSSDYSIKIDKLPFG